VNEYSEIYNKPSPARGMCITGSIEELQKKVKRL